MPPRGRKKQGRRSFTLRYLNCNRQYIGNYFHDGKITGRLNSHIFRSPICYDYYAKRKLLIEQTGDPRLSTSIVNNDDQQSPAKKRRMVVDSSSTHQFTPTDFGLTGTTNGPCPPKLLGIKPSTSNKIDHTRMNLQTLYVGNQPSISRENIETALQTMQENPCAAAARTMGNSSSTSAAGDDKEPFHSSPTGGLALSDVDMAPAVDFNDDDSISVPGAAQLPPDHQNTTTQNPHLVVARSTVVRVGSCNPEEEEAVTTMDESLTAAVELMHILIENRCHLKMLPQIMKWTLQVASRPGNETLFQTMAPMTYHTLLRHVRQHLHPNTTTSTSAVYDHFRRIPIPWLPNNTPIDLHIRPFQVALDSLLRNRELMQQSKLSLPNVDNPFSYVNNPEVDVISELHHGNWWRNSWREANCDPQKNEILVPIILYMDGISLDTHGRLSLTPLNMTLGIFSTETRKSNYAWETLYFHPPSSHLTCSPSALDNLKNLHRGLGAALASFKDICNTETILRDLPWNNTIYKNVSMKFAIAFIIGDTELHDKLCGRYSGRHRGTKFICRHCNCPTDDLVNVQAQATTRLWIPEDFAIPVGEIDRDHWKNLSHHPIENVFDNINFGSNPHKIHFATPGECLHMHQLGVAKRSLEVLKDAVTKKNDERRGRRAQAWDELSLISNKFGNMLSRQSDQNFPRTKFTAEILEHTKKNGKDYPGVIVSLVLALLSTEAKNLLNSSAFIDNSKINDWIRTLEYILFFDEFFQQCGLRTIDLGRLPSLVNDFVTRLTTNFHREQGMGDLTVKNHLYFHLHKYISMFGPPAGWDSSACEGHHKMDIKAPSKNTQQHASSLIEQTFRRKMEYQDLRAVLNSPAYRHREPTLHQSRNIKEQIGGSKFSIRWNENNEPYMVWEKKESNDTYSHFPQDVLKYCCDTFLPKNHPTANEPLIISGFTELNHQPEVGGECFKFRSHPSYRSKSGQNCGVWYDWANFVYLVGGNEDGDNPPQEQIAPAQILCLLNLTLKQAKRGASHLPNPTAGAYAVVRSFRNPPSRFRQSRIVRRGLVGDDFYVYSCTSICGPVAVVHHANVAGGKEFFVVGNKSHWLKCFHDILREQPT